MAIDWEIHGLGFGNCNCDYSCPCQFEALPTHGDCKGTGFFQIDEGHFGDIPLAGLKMGAIYAWPGPIHEGKGKCQIFIDSNANDAQRKALTKISRGEEAEPFSNIFTVYAAMCDQIYDPIFTEIEFQMDMENRTAKCIAKGVVEASGEPIIGVAGNKHRAQIRLPEGIEYRVAEIGRGRCRVQGKIELELDDGFAQFNEVHLNHSGVIG
ncbi:MAG: DUF1326 domain-containing protein [Gammaproteobacteria bacterium]|nr:DUF1326 domain-containing protein [Gammaproteobacteria bacterium]